MDSSDTPLAFGVPSVGERSETFIRMHVNDVLPGRTAVFSESVANPAHWMPEGPTMSLYRSSSPFERKLRHGAERIGLTQANKLRQFLKQHGVQTVVCEYLHSFLPYLPVVKDMGLRWFSFGHGYDVSALLSDPSWVSRLAVLKQADGVIVRAQVIKDRLQARLGLRPDQIHVVYSSAPVPDQMTEHAPGELIRVVAVGRMVPKKGPLLVLRSFERALKEVPNLRLTYIGEGPLFEEAKAFAQANLTPEVVSLPGGQPFPEVLRAMTQADLLVQHSLVNPTNGDEEGVPAVIVEAMGRGLPIVSTRHAGISEVVRDGIEGLISEEGNVEAMAQNIVSLAKDANRRLTMGQNAYQRASQNFTQQHERMAILRAIGMEQG